MGRSLQNASWLGTQCVHGILALIHAESRADTVHACGVAENESKPDPEACLGEQASSVRASRSVQAPLTFVL